MISNIQNILTNPTAQKAAIAFAGAAVGVGGTLGVQKLKSLLAWRKAEREKADYSAKAKAEADKAEESKAKAEESEAKAEEPKAEAEEPKAEAANTDKAERERDEKGRFKKKDKAA